MTTPAVEQVQVELLRRRADGSIVPWLLNDDGTEPVADAAARVKLDALEALLGGTLDVHLASVSGALTVSGTVSLPAEQVAALGPRAVQPVSGTVTVQGLPNTYPLPPEQVQALTPLPTQPVSGTVAVSNQPAQPQQGTWAYRAGTAGTVTVTGRVLGIAAHSPTGTTGSVTINSGDPIPVPAGAGIELAPRGTLTGPTLTFTGTDSFMVEVVA